MYEMLYESLKKSHPAALSDSFSNRELHVEQRCKNSLKIKNRFSHRYSRDYHLPSAYIRPTFGVGDPQFFRSCLYRHLPIDIRVQLYHTNNSCRLEAERWRIFTNCSLDNLHSLSPLFNGGSKIWLLYAEILRLPYMFRGKIKVGVFLLSRFNFGENRGFFFIK